MINSYFENQRILLEMKKKETKKTPERYVQQTHHFVPPMSQFQHRPALVPRLTRPSTAVKLRKTMVYKESLLHRLLN